MAIKLLLVDDHEIVRIGLKNLFSGADAIKLVGEVDNGKDALDIITKKKPDVVLLDVRLEDVDGLAVLGRIKWDYPELAVVMFSGYDNPTYIARAVALDAAGFVLKSATNKKLLEVIYQAAEEGYAWSREELRRVIGALSAPRMNLKIDVPLTQREGEVLKQLALGLTNKQIAHQLDVSYETVKEHVQHVLRKIGVGDRTQAAIWAVRKDVV
ncbi:MAG: response regulator transcription factor [Pirellulaceae bacterium]|nr:response regulator transcription factor [Pirellulaceae bacterium]